VNAALVAGAAAVAVLVFVRWVSRGDRTLEDHIQEALATVGPIEHTVRPLFELIVLGDDRVAVYCEAHDAMLADGPFVYGPAALAACREHARREHAAVTW
jgi:hypothetical protein